MNNVFLVHKWPDATNYSKGFDDGNDPQHTQLNDFEYDDYGNMVEDRNKGITEIIYNHLNLPKEIKFGTNGTIIYLYDANGNKLKKKVTDGIINKTVDYLSGFQYTNETLEFFPHAEGYVTVNTNQLNDHYNYVFNYTDHLGNIRLKYTAHPQTGETQPLEENHYYPFGLTHDGYQPNHKIIGFEGPGANVTIIPTSPNVGDPYKYKFGGKEYQEEFDVNVYDFGARNYDPALGRWMNVDPLAEQMRRHSPYNYAFNNPVVFIDPDGMAPDTVIVTGDLADKATEQLNASTNGEINITKGDDGTLDYTRNGEGPLSKDTQQLVDAIDDKSVTVNVEASSSDISSKNGKQISGGEFQGSDTEFDGFGNAISESYQQINPIGTDNIDYANNTPGKAAQHEVVEGYLGGVEAQKRGLESVGPATRSDASNPNSVYRTAHDAAPVGNSKTIYNDPSDNRTYIKTSWGAKVYLQQKKN